MIPDRMFIQHCAALHHRNIPKPLEDWILANYEDEPYPNAWDQDMLEGLICLYCDNYWSGLLDISIKPPYERLLERYSDLKDLVMDLMVENEYLNNQNNQYHRILKEHGLI